MNIAYIVLGFGQIKGKITVYYFHLINISITIHVFPQLDPRRRNWKQWNQALNKNKHPKKRKPSDGKKKIKKAGGAIQTSFCIVRFKFVVDLLLPHETATAQRKRGYSVQELPWKNPPDDLGGHPRVTPRSSGGLCQRCGCVSVSFSGGGERMLCVFVSGSANWKLTDAFCQCGVQGVKMPQSRGGVSAEDRMP